VEKLRSPAAVPGAAGAAVVLAAGGPSSGIA